MPVESAGLVSFLFQVVLISLSGVMYPGPTTAAAIATGAVRRHSGAWLAAGHIIVELPIIILITAGVAEYLKLQGVRIALGFVGGSFLILMGVRMLLTPKTAGGASASRVDRHPVWIGVILTAANPYFLIWWATVGLRLATEVAALGIFAFALFALTHWLCDLVWLEILSNASFKGAQVFGDKTQKIVPALCAALMLLFGAMFLWDAACKTLS